jgi:thiosulfate reductase cytochrome b subunit
MVWPLIVFGALYMCYMLVAHTLGTCFRNCAFFGHFTLVAIVMLFVVYQVVRAGG